MRRLYRHQSLDERRVPFKGRAPQIRRNPSKPIRIGWTMTAAVDMFTKYLWTFHLEDGSLTAENCKSLPYKMRGQQVVQQVEDALRMSRYNKGICLYIDRLYSSVALARKITELGCYMTGTIDKNRGVPSIASISSKKPTTACPRGTIKVAFCGNMHVWGFMDNSSCHIIDTFLGGKTESRDSKLRDGTMKSFTFPCAKFLFNSFMGGCDQVDQMTANRKGWCTTTMNIITQKWTLRLGFDAMFDLIHGNCWAIARMLDPRLENHTKWILAAADSFLRGTHAGIQCQRRTRNGVDFPVTPSKRICQVHRLSSPHNPEHMSVKINQTMGRSRGKNCAWCLILKSKGQLNGRVGETVLGCATCREYLHDGKCHIDYHRSLENDPQSVVVHRRKILSVTDGRTKLGQAVRGMVSVRGISMET